MAAEPRAVPWHDPPLPAPGLAPPALLSKPEKINKRQGLDRRTDARRAPEGLDPLWQQAGAMAGVRLGRGLAALGGLAEALAQAAELLLAQLDLLLQLPLLSDEG